MPGLAIQYKQSILKGGNRGTGSFRNVLCMHDVLEGLGRMQNNAARNGNLPDEFLISQCWLDEVLLADWKDSQCNRQLRGIGRMHCSFFVDMFLLCCRQHLNI